MELTAIVPQSIMDFMGYINLENYSWLNKCQMAIDYMGDIRIQNGTLLSNFICALSHMLILPFMVATQRSIQEVFAAFHHINPTWGEAQWEMFLIRNVVNRSQWPDMPFIYVRHPELDYCLWDLIQMYQVPNSLVKEVKNRLFLAFVRLDNSLNQELPRLKRFMKHMKIFMQESPPSGDYTHFFKTVFLRPVFHHSLTLDDIDDPTKKRSHTDRIRISDRFAIPAVMRRFVSKTYLFEDLAQLDNMFTKSRANDALVRLQELQLVESASRIELEFYLVEQSSLMIEMATQNYLTGPLVKYSKHIIILPRTINTCYIMATNLGLQALRYAFLTEIVAPKVNENFSISDSKQTRPWAFPILFRTWLEGTTIGQQGIDHLPTTSITQHSDMKKLAIHQVIMATIKLCYIIANKKLYNTWMQDQFKNGSDRFMFRWTSDMNRAMFSMTDAQFYPFYSQFFSLLHTICPTSEDLRQLVFQAAQHQPPLDDYKAPQCSLFTFVESFVFIRAKHAIRKDTIEWLYAWCRSAMQPHHGMIYKKRSYPYLIFSFLDPDVMSALNRMNRALQEFPVFIDTINLLTIRSRSLKQSLPGDNDFQKDFDDTYLTLPCTSENEILLVQYYAFCLSAMLTKQEIHKLVFSCRLAPNHRFESKRFSDDDLMDVDDESSMDYSIQDASINKPLVVDPEDEEAREIMKQLAELEKTYQEARNMNDDEDDEDEDLEMDDFLNAVDNDDSNNYSDDDFSQSSVDRSLNKKFPHGSKKRNRHYMQENQSNVKRARLDDDKDKKIKRHMDRFSSWRKMLFNQMVIKQDIFVSKLPNSLAFPSNQVSPDQRKLELDWFFLLEECSKNKTHDQISPLNASMLDCFNANNAFVLHLAKDSPKHMIDPFWFDSTMYSSTFLQQIQRFSYQNKTMSRNGFFKLMMSSQIRMFFDTELFHIPSIIRMLFHPYPIENAQRHVLETIFESSLWDIGNIQDESLLPSTVAKQTPEEMAKKHMPPPLEKKLPIKPFEPINYGKIPKKGIMFSSFKLDSPSNGKSPLHEKLKPQNASMFGKFKL